MKSYFGRERVTAGLQLLTLCAALCGAGVAQARGIQTDSPLSTVSCGITFGGDAVTFDPGLGGSPSCVSTTTTEAANHIPSDISGDVSNPPGTAPVWENWPAGNDSDATEQVEIWTLNDNDLAIYFNYASTCTAGDTATFSVAGVVSYSLANACGTLGALTTDAFDFLLSTSANGGVVVTVGEGGSDWTTGGSGTGSTGVPEPATLALVIVGLAGFVATRRRRPVR